MLPQSVVRKFGHFFCFNLENDLSVLVLPSAEAPEKRRNLPYCAANDEGQWARERMAGH